MASAHDCTTHTPEQCGPCAHAWPSRPRPMMGEAHARWRLCTDTPALQRIRNKLWVPISAVYVFTTAPSDFYVFPAVKSLTIQSTHRHDGAALDVYVGHPGPLLTKIKSRYSPTCERKSQGGDTRAETSQRARTTTVGTLQVRRCRSSEHQHCRDKARSGRVPATHHGTRRCEEMTGDGSGRAGHVRAMSAAEHSNGTAMPRAALRR